MSMAKIYWVPTKHQVLYDLIFPLFSLCRYYDIFIYCGTSFKDEKLNIQKVWVTPPQPKKKKHKKTQSW